MLTTHAVGIDLGTTYSCIAYLNEHGEPVTLPNQEGELATPSVVMFDTEEVIVGTEALRNAILYPQRIVQNSKRYIGDRNHRWFIDDKPYTPIDIATCILKKLLSAAQEQIGSIEQAVITVPAQFSDAQRHATIDAGHRAGLQRVDIINEPVAAALCYVLGTEGLWFTELADEQRILVYDLGGGTFDLSMVKYEKNEVSVVASSGDLNLGGIDWNHALEQAICNQFAKEFSEDPREDAESLQYLANEVEQTKRSLSVRPRAALTCQHAGYRKTYQVELPQFEKLTKDLVKRTEGITKRLLKDNKLGWAHVDVVLITGGASRMPMVRSMLKKASGRTLNTALSPDLSIAHGATYYAGMLLTNSKFAKSILRKKAIERLSQVRQQSVNARALGILVRDLETGKRFPHYLVPANTPLPAAITQNYGTVIANQRRVHLQIIESGTSPEAPFVKLGACVIDDLPKDIPEGSEIAVTISYDAAARVQVQAKDVTSGKLATAEILRQENLVPQLESDQKFETEGLKISEKEKAQTPKGNHKPPKARPKAETPSPQKKKKPQPAVRASPKPAIGRPNAKSLEEASQPVPLCNECGEPLNLRGECAACGVAPPVKKPKKRPAKAGGRGQSKKSPQAKTKPRPASKPTAKPHAEKRRRVSEVPPPVDDDIIELDNSAIANPPGASKPERKGSGNKTRKATSQATKKRKPPDVVKDGEDEFFKYAD